MWEQLRQNIIEGNTKALARCISLIENEVDGYEHFLQSLPVSDTPVIGITGPPGAGKSTLTDALIGLMTAEGKRIAVLCVDPSSAFNFGALLGDRIRMSEWYTHPSVFIRSLATRGSLGGLHPKIIEITDVLKFARFDYIIVETVGVGQSEVEIAGLADVTVVTLVPEAGDEVQTMKAGLMEIADIFVVNKADRPGADNFVNHLNAMLAPAFASHERKLPILKATASQGEGVKEIYNEIAESLGNSHFNEKKHWLLTEKACQLIQKKRMKGIEKKQIIDQIRAEGRSFNLYRYVASV